MCTKPREKLILSIWAAIPIALVLWGTFSKSPTHFSWILPICFVWIVLGAPGLYFLFNARVKKSIREIGIKPTPGIFSFWANTEYREYKLKKFHASLADENLLTNSERDIQLTEQYLKFCDEESKDSYKTVKFAFGGIIIAFFIPVWNQYLTWLFKNANKEYIGKIVLVSLAVVLLFASVLIIVSLFLTAYADHSNKTSSKFKDISKHLKKLNLNLQLKYR